MPDDLFLCSKCQRLQPLDAFYPSVQVKVAAGYKHHCIACQKAWQVANHAACLTYNVTYYAKHRLELRAKARLIPQETQRRYDRTLRERHRESIRAKHRILARKRWAANPEKARLQGRIKRYLRSARHQGAMINDLSRAQIEELIAAKQSRCDYCGRKCAPITIDHITPIVNQGNNTLWNVTIACISCNSKKMDGPPPMPVQPLLLTIAPSRKRKKEPDIAHV